MLLLNPNPKSQRRGVPHLLLPQPFPRNRMESPSSRVTVFVRFPVKHGPRATTTKAIMATRCDLQMGLYLENNAVCCLFWGHTGIPHLFLQTNSHDWSYASRCIIGLPIFYTPVIMSAPQLSSVQGDRVLAEEQGVCPEAESI